MTHRLCMWSTRRRTAARWTTRTLGLWRIPRSVTSCIWMRCGQQCARPGRLISAATGGGSGRNMRMRGCRGRLGRHVRICGRYLPRPRWCWGSTAPTPVMRPRSWLCRSETCHTWMCGELEACGGEQEVAGEDEVRLADALLLGRKTYEALSAIWSKTAGEFAGEQHAKVRRLHVPGRVARVERVAHQGRPRRGGTPAQADHTGNLLNYGCGEFAINLVTHRLSRRCIWFPIVWNEPSRPLRCTAWT